MFIFDFRLIRSEPLFCEEKLTFWSKSTHGYLICSPPWFFHFFFVFSIAPTIVLTGLHPFYNTTQHLIRGSLDWSWPLFDSKCCCTTLNLWNTEKPLFMGKNSILQLWDTSKGIYPWETTTSWKYHFLLTKRPLFETRNGCFVRKNRRSLIWTFGVSFLRL